MCIYMYIYIIHRYTYLFIVIHPPRSSQGKDSGGRVDDTTQSSWSRMGGSWRSVENGQGFLVEPKDPKERL